MRRAVFCVALMSVEASDDVLIGCAQAIEHYEIARYRLLRTWARKLGY